MADPVIGGAPASAVATAYNRVHDSVAAIKATLAAVKE